MLCFLEYKYLRAFGWVADLHRKTFLVFRPRTQIEIKLVLYVEQFMDFLMS